MELKKLPLVLCVCFAYFGSSKTSIFLVHVDPIPENYIIFIRTNWPLNIFGSSGNHTPGSRFYFELLDTSADSLCIHQLVLQCRSKR